MLGKRNSDRKRLFEEYIKPTYYQGKQVYENLLEGLQQAKELLLNDEDIDTISIVDFLKKARFPLKNVREELRNRMFLTLDRRKKNTNFYVFEIVIRDSLCGGMTGEFLSITVI